MKWQLFLLLVMMKKATFFFLIIATLATTFYSCKTNTDDLWDSIHQLDGRVTSLEELCKQMNGNISSLQKLVQALQDNNSITKVTPIKEGEKVIGYTISFTKGEPITIYHGEKGEQGDKGDDGATPVITVDQDGETYYWKVNGEWLTDKQGNKIPTTGKDGQDAVSPQLEIRNGRWFLFNGETWTDIGQATGDAGKDGDSFFESVEEKEGYVEFTLPSGTVLTIPKNTLSIVKDIKSVSYIPRYDDGKATVVGTSKSDSYIELNFEISPKESADLLVKHDGVVSVQGVYTTIRSRAIDFIQFPVLAISAEDGILSLKVSGENLDDVFFAGTQGAQLALKLEDSESTYISDYIGVVPSLPVYTFTTTYETTYSNQTIKIANDIDAYPIAGAGNRLISIDYGDGTNGISSTHTYATQGEYTVTFSFVNEVTEIGENAFEDCINLISIVLPETLVKIGDETFRRTGLIDITIPSSITYVGALAFADCQNVKTIYIPYRKNSYWGYWVFEWTPGEVYLDCDNSVDSPTQPSFFSSSHISKLTIGKNVTYLCDQAFVGCKYLESVQFEKNSRLKSIGTKAFAACSSLLDFEIPVSVNHIGDYAFSDCEKMENISAGNEYYISYFGVLYTRDYHTLVSYPAGKKDQSFDFIAEVRVKEIAPGAFWGAKQLKRISFSNAQEMTNIGNMAFKGCTNLSQLENFTNLRLTRIASEAFENTNLSSLTIPQNVQEIADYAFANCRNLAGGLTIPDRVESIGEKVFHNCTGLIGSELKLGKNLKSIGRAAFSYNFDDIYDPSNDLPIFSTIYCNATTPPQLGSLEHDVTFGSEVFGYKDDNIISLIVPYGCFSVYSNSIWSTIGKRIQIIEGSNH